MNKQILIILCLIFLTGCFNIEINHYIYSDETQRIEMVYDFENLISISNMMGENNPDDFINNICDDFKEDFEKDFEGKKIKNEKCERINNKVYISFDIISEDLEIINKGNTYTFLLKKDSPFLEGFSEADSFNDMGEDLDEEINPELLKMNMKYIIHFENDIIESKYGQIEGNKLIFDLTKMPEINENFYITAKTINTNNSKYITRIVVGIVFLILISITIYLLIKKSKKKEYKTINEDIITPRIKKIIDWIHLNQYKYNDETLKKSLRTSTEITEQEIQIAFRNK